MRWRPLYALLASLAIHAGAAIGVLGAAAWEGWKLTRPVEVELTSIKTEEVKELPLGDPPPKAAETPVVGPPRRRARTKVALKGDGAKVAVADGGAVDGGDKNVPDAGAADAGGVDAGSGRPRDLRAYGPAGSRLTALLRLDRLRRAPEAPSTIAAVDALLRRLPDRRRLIDGTGLDMYRDFDALLIATPNPLDDAVTFLAVRHHLPDEQIMAALAKGAEAAGRPITWRTEGGRPTGVRRRAEAGEESPLDRDDRILVLPQPGLAVMAPPAYARLLTGDVAGAEARWRSLIARIDAEDGAMPEEAILMMTAANLIERKGQKSTPEAPRLAVPGGLELPGVMTLISGTDPTPFLDVTAEFERAADATAWEGQWRVYRQKLLSNPLVLLGGLMPIISRAEVTRDEGTLRLRTTSTHEEARRLLGLITNLLAGAHRR